MFERISFHVSEKLHLGGKGKVNNEPGPLLQK